MMMNVVYFKKYNTILFIFEVPHLAGVDHIPSEEMLRGVQKHDILENVDLA